MINQPIEFAVDAPLNNLSFGNVTIALLREMYTRGLQPNLFPIGGQVDISAQKPDERFNQWLQHCINKAQKEHCRRKTALKLWHINGSLTSYSETDARLITFHELDQITAFEINGLKNQDKVYVTSRFTQEVFKTYGVDSTYLPLGFDSHNFAQFEKRPKVEGAISFGLAGKFEARKSTARILNLWAKRYGNNAKYRLNVAVSNPFLVRPGSPNPHEEAWQNTLAAINQALEGKHYWNIVPHRHMGANVEYSSFLQTNDIHLAMSGGEAWDLPAYHATALGAHLVALKAHVYPEWANDESAVFVNPNGKRPAVDGHFFHANSPYNIGNFFDFADSDFYAACEEAEKRVAKGINLAGLELQKHTYAEAVDILLEGVK